MYNWILSLEGERGESHLISIGRLVYVPVTVPRVDEVMRYHRLVVGPLQRMFPDRGNGLGVRVERLFLPDR